MSNNKYLSTPRVRLHRARKRLKQSFEGLLFQTTNTENLKQLEEQLQQLLIEADATAIIKSFSASLEFPDKGGL